MAPTVAPSGSTFQDITRIVWVAQDARYRGTYAACLGRYHARLLRAYGVSYLERAQGSDIGAELEGATWNELVRAALNAGFPVRVDALDAYMKQRAQNHADDDSIHWSVGMDGSNFVLRPAYLTSCRGCSLPMFTDTTTRQFCNGCLRRHERDKKRNQRGTDLSDRLCSACGAGFTPKRSTATYCSTKCRVASHRAKAKAG